VGGTISILGIRYFTKGSRVRKRGRGKDWFEPVLNMPTPLLPTLTLSFFICHSPNQFFLFPNGRHIDCLSLAYVISKSKKIKIAQ